MPTHDESARRAVRMGTALVAAGYAVAAVAIGLRTNDDTVLFDAWGSALRGCGFDHGCLARETRFVVPTAFYSGWITVVALLQVAAGESWRTTLVGLNWLAMVAVAAGALELVRRLGASALAVGVTALLFFFAGELWLWVPYALSDSTFVALSFGLFGAAARTLGAPGRGGMRALPLLTFAALVALYRPGGLPYALVVAASLALAPLFGADAERRRRRARAVVAIQLVAAGLLVTGHAALMRDPSLWPVRALAPWIRSLSADARAGQVMFARPELDHAPPRSLGDHVWLTVAKVHRFAAPTAPSLRLERKLLAVVAWPVLWLLAAVGAISAWRGRFGDRGWWTAWLAAQVFCCVALFHGLQVVDRDWRYRAPCVPPLLVLAGLGAARLEVRLARRDT
jgi:hypothetical protein